jgi:hypothetical protein
MNLMMVIAMFAEHNMFARVKVALTSQDTALWN